MTDQATPPDVGIEPAADPELVEPALPTDRAAVLVARDVHVAYRTELDMRRSLRRRTTGHATKRHIIHAVRGVDLTLYEGECLGIVGSNGSGKSTLLAALAGLLPTEQGEVQAVTRPALLGVGAVLNQKLSGRRNIELGCLALGMSRAEIGERMDDIIAFTGLGDAINRPLGSYSSGMRARLAFTVATEMSPEILFIDEALAVGDRRFRLRAAQRLEDIRDDAGAIVLVSHNVNEVSMMCTRAAWMEEGQVQLMGSVDEVLGAYAEANPDDQRAARLMKRKARQERRAKREDEKKSHFPSRRGRLP